ncbi:hypothetical protein D3C80_1771960 [compost metagenome]
MTRVEQVKNWLEGLPQLAGYTFSRGAWPEQEPGEQFVAIWSDDGRRDVDEELAYYRVTITGQRGKRADGLIVLGAAEAIYSASLSACIGDAVRVLPRGGIVGPGYTTEGRAWAELTLELLI